ncbi:MAG: Uma2 family endonuclease [Chloroflexota bacterium]|nr:Uma2 family endonuclease [Chloroflexota bacterium]
MTTTMKFTIADLEGLPQKEGARYEIIGGELHVSTQPSWQHQFVCGELIAELREWGKPTNAGRVIPAPGLVFARDEAVAPDVVWVSRARLGEVLGQDGKLHAAPDLVVEVLSPGRTNERRDRELKLDLYSRRGVQEYWIVDWEERQLDVYRHQAGALLRVATLREADELVSPLLPDFRLPLGRLFADLT